MQRAIYYRGLGMEYFLLHRNNYHRLISEEDEFYYPLIFQTPLLNSRFLGKIAELAIRGRKGKFSGMLIGVTERTLLSQFKGYFSFRPETLNASSLPFGEDEHEWMEAHLKLKPFPEIRYISKPRSPPYFILLSEIRDLLVFSSFSESELEDLPQINYNKIITNEAIEQLTSYVKSNLPRKLRGKHKAPIHENLEAKLKQLRISKFLKAAEEKVAKE